MKSFWRTKGKRIGAVLLALLILAGAIPYTNMGTVRAAEGDGQFAGVTVSVTVKVQGTGEADSKTGAEETVAYTGAAVTVTYPAGEGGTEETVETGGTEETEETGGTGETTTVSATESEESEGTYSAVCAGWTPKAGDSFTLTVKPKEGDQAVYQEYSETYTIESNDETGTPITKEVTLEKKPVYSVTVRGTEGAGTVSVSDKDEATKNDGTDIPEGDARTVTAEPAEGYEITAVTVKKGEASWTPNGGEDNTWWKDFIDSESGVFTYSIASVDANYEFAVVFTKKTFTMTYSLGANGKLTLNSNDTANAIEITTAAEDGERSVEYTDAAYTIKASVTDDAYHLSSFKIDGQEQITDADTAGGANQVIEKSYTFETGITQAHTIAVTAVINSYTVSVEQNEGGTVTQGGATLENGCVTVTSGGELTFDITPLTGYKVAGITVNGETASPAAEEWTVGKDESYQYKITVEKDEKLAVTFAAVTPDIKTLAESGLTFKNEDGTILTPDAGNVCYAEEFTVSAAGKELRLSESGAYQEELTVDESQLFTTVYMRDAEPSAFGTEQKLELSAPISLVIDNASPVISLTDAEREIWKNGNEADPSADITGTITDENPDRVVWSASELTPAAVLSEQTNVVNGFTENGAFSITGLQLAEGADTDVFYLYAVDKAGNCSAAETVTVKRDGTAPEITGVSIAPALKQLAYGNFLNTAIVLTITTKDVDAGADGTVYHASGIQKAEIYAGDAENPVYTEEADTPETGSDEKIITVTIPLGAGEAFADLTEVRIKVTDRMGNVSGGYKLTDFAQLTDGGMESGKLMLENTAPEIGLTPAVEAYRQTAGTDTYCWYKEIPVIAYQVTDKADGKNGSGLAAREITLNDIPLASYTKSDYSDAVTDYESSIQEETGAITAEELSQMTDGKNVVKIQFEDQAGNKAETSAAVYLDTHAPEITGFDIAQKNTMLGKILNILSFGTFSNGTVTITVTARDTGDEDKNTVSSSGLKEITLYLNGNEYAAAAVTENKTATFELPAETLLDGEKYLYTAVAASATDHVGNQSEAYAMTTGNSNLLNTGLMLETIQPVMDITFGQQGCMGADGIVINNADTEFAVRVSDADSGLRSVRISINGAELENKVYSVDGAEAVKEDTFTVTTADAAITDDGLYTMTVMVVDNAGNQAETVRSVYKDETAPEILSFDMQAEGTAEADGTIFSEMDYGYYFLEDTRVTVYATDGTRAGDSGVREIRYYTVDANGTRGTTTAVAADADGKASFVIPAEFKGQIYACAYDQLFNSTGNYVNPSGLIIETAEQHAKEEHISYQKSAAPYKDSTGGELYAGNVNVTVTVADTFSGIRKVEWSVEAPYDTAANQSGAIELGNDGEFITGSSTDGWNKTKIEKNLVTELQKTIVVSNNSNDIAVHVQMTDRAGNTSEKKLVFGIDRTVPTIEVSFDNETPDAENTEMYKESRVATITVKERNFTSEAIAVAITNTDGAVPEISGWETSESAGNPDETVSTATITFSEDGDYTLEISGRDAANNVAESVKAEAFTIDKTEPVITVSYDTENAVNGNYFAAERTATIQIEEHNFSAERVKITGTATDGGAQISFPQASGWTSAGDVHTATIVCGTDGLYRFDVEFTDMAGNEAEIFTGEEYYVDMTEPVIEITGVEDMSANNGDVIPRVALSDTNYDVNGVNIELTGANRGAVTPEGSYTTQADGQIFTFSNFPVEQTYDDIYTLTAALTDMAGNESTETITFSVNRFGSVYVFDDSLKKIAGTYIQNEVDVRLTEVNVDSLEHDKIKVVVDANGIPTDLTEGTDYTVRESGGNGSWYQYDYTIDKSLFAGDGRYIVTLYSEDVAGNVNENIDESKEAEITFGIDKTAPVVIPIDIESDTQYPVDVKSATVTVNDNLVLSDVEVYIGDEKCAYTADGENYTFQVPSSTERRDITVAATDAAGNRTNYVISKVLVTTNVLVRWYNNKPLFVGTLIGVAGISGAGVGLAAVLRRRRIKIRK